MTTTTSLLLCEPLSARSTPSMSDKHSLRSTCWWYPCRYATPKSLFERVHWITALSCRAVEDDHFLPPRPMRPMKSLRCHRTHVILLRSCTYPLTVTL
jgi:hypothetical protein